MRDNLNHNVLQKSTLAESEIAAIQQLIVTCNARDGLRMRIGAELLRNRPGNTINDFLYYEDGQLIGYLCGDSWGSREKELTGMVHPFYRRQGIARVLFEAARVVYTQNGVQRLILVCEHASSSGQAYIAALGAAYDFSEYEMVLGTFHERGKMMEGGGERGELLVRQANADDIDTIVSILAADSGNRVDVQAWITYLMARPERSRFFIATLHGKPLGTIRLDNLDDEMGIYAFEVRLGYRGLGYGRQIMEHVIRVAQSESHKPIMLDVDTTNANAIGLYRSVGFEIRTTYDYYAMELS